MLSATGVSLATGFSSVAKAEGTVTEIITVLTRQHNKIFNCKRIRLDTPYT
jgi:orotate phosphoribosyltransferase